MRFRLRVVQIRPQVHISRDCLFWSWSVTILSFVEKDASDVLKGVGVVYKVYPEQKPPVEANGLKGSRTNFIVPTDGATVQIRYQVHISKRLSALGLTRHGFVFCRKDDSVGLKGVGVVYKLPFVSSTKRYETILVYQEDLPLSQTYYISL
jgi:hypothetical protein